MPDIRTDKPWETLALTAALPGDRELLSMLIEFDHRLERIVATSSEPMLGQIRLAWWRDVLASGTPPKGEPLIGRLQALRGSIDWPIAGSLGRMVDGWEARLLVPDDRNAFAQGRGEGLFRGFAGLGDWLDLDAAGRCWALIGFEGGADDCLDVRALRRWPRRLRPLSLLALAGCVHGRLAGLRLSWHGLTGR